MLRKIAVSFSKALRTSLLVACSLTLAGCGGNLVTVKGKVTLDGEPLSGATVSFVPAEGSDKLGTPVGLTDESGIFYLTTREQFDGAVPGEYRVCIKKYSMPERQSTSLETPHDRESANAYAKALQSRGGRVDYITPIDYADKNKTPFTVKIPSSEALEFDLKSDFKYSGPSGTGSPSPGRRRVSG